MIRWLYITIISFLEVGFLAGTCASTNLINNEIDEILIQHSFSGVALVSNAQVQFHKAYGTSKNDPIDINSKFPIASISKTLTSSLVLLELNKSRMSVTTPLYIIDPLFSLLDKRITFADLLTHQSGIGSYTDFNELGEDRSDALQSEVFLERIKKTKGLYGTFSYNNGNFILLEKILEKITERSFKELLDDTILKPQQMNNTGLIKTTQQDPLVIGKTKDGTIASPIAYSWLGGGAGLYSTASDLYNFAYQFICYGILPESLVEEAWTDRGGQYGYGWTIGKINNKKVYWHEGGIDGFCTMLMIEPESSSILIMLCNDQGIEIEDISKTIFCNLLKDKS